MLSCAIAVLGVVLFLDNVLWIRELLAGVFGSTTVTKVTASVSGQVVDSAGKPVANAMVRCDWIVWKAEQECFRGLLALTTDVGGNYSGLGEHPLGGPSHADDIKVEVKLQAGAPLRDTQPSEQVVRKLGAASEAKVTLKLGESLPKVSLRVVDTAGDPITKIWVKCVPVEGPRDDMLEPRCHGDFEGGVVSVAHPMKPFRIRVQMRGNGRMTLIGPFDPEELPEQIEVTLPDR